MSAPRRVLVTGIGTVTALGGSLERTREALAQGLSVAGSPSRFDASAFGVDRVGEVRDFDPRPHFRLPKALKLTDVACRLAVSAASMALADADWPSDSPLNERLGVLVGCSGSDLQVEQIGQALASAPESDAASNIGWFAERILGGLNPLWLIANLPNMVSAHVAIQMQARGPNSTVMTDWIAGAQAIGEAADWIRAGECDAVLAGGSDSALVPLAFAGFSQARLMDRPAGDEGFVPAEGAAIMLIEEAERARSRGAHAYGEIVTCAVRADGQPHARPALTRAIDRVLEETDWRASDIEAIATAFVPDRADENGRAVRCAFDSAGRAGRTPPTIDHISRLGHTLAASGPLALSLLLASGHPLDDCRGLLCLVAGYSGQAAAIAARRVRDPFRAGRTH